MQQAGLQREQGPAPIMQSHIGLGNFVPGSTVAYENGWQFTPSRIPLFPTQPDFNEWMQDMRSLERTTAIKGQKHLPYNEWEMAHERLKYSSAPWQDCAILDDAGWARVRRHPTARARAKPTYVALIYLAKGIAVRQRPLPFTQQAPVTTEPTLPEPPPEWLKQEVAKNLHSWEDCISSEAKSALEGAVRAAKRDEAMFGGESASEHRQRARVGEARAEVRIGPDKFHPTVNKVLKLGYTIDLTADGRPRIREISPLTAQDWGIDVDAIRRDAGKINWPDKELLFFLRFGFMDYSGNAPPVCSFSPHQQKAFRNFRAFREQVREEIANNWIGPARDHPPSIPFQVRPGSLEPKTGGRVRLVWNASWPVPGSFQSAVQLGDEWFPVAPNACTRLPIEIQFEWAAIEAHNEAIEIMAEAAKAADVPLLGRTFDMTKWFRQLGVASLDLWKCTVYAEGGFREDKRMQMGRRSSAHSGQRTTMLLTALLQEAAHQEGWGVRTPQECCSESEKVQQSRLAAWREARAEATRTDNEAGAQRPQNCLVYFSAFQDDITAVAVGQAAADDAKKGVPRILEGRYGVQLSSKPEATRDFSPSFESIGAKYDLSDPSRVLCMPRDETMHKYEAALEELIKRGKLVPLRDMQRFAGLHTFMSRFLPDGEFYCNSAYCCLRAIPHTSANLRPVSAALLQDAKELLMRLKQNRIAPLTANPIFSHPGHQGFTADASGGTGASASGWGVHLQGLVVKGSWPTKVKTALREGTLSISPLELLAAAIAVHKAGRNSDRLPAQKRLILKSDSESTCAVANSNRADSAPMLEALRVFKEAKEVAGLETRLQYIPTQENTIADSLSRGKYEAAKRQASAHGVYAVATPPLELNQWCSRVLAAALQATRHKSDSL